MYQYYPLVLANVKTFLNLILMSSQSNNVLTIYNVQPLVLKLIRYITIYGMFCIDTFWPFCKLVGSPNCLSWGSIEWLNAGKGPWSITTVWVAIVPDLAKSDSENSLKCLKILQNLDVYYFNLNKACDWVISSAGRSPWLYLSMFVSEICEQTSNISDHGVEIVNQTEKSNIK